MEELAVLRSDMELILSIVVPVYNVEKYLKKCVYSLLDQDIEKRQYEIILVDDGSTDDSGSLCDEFARSISSVKVIHQVNQGLSVARNTGIAVAEGKYILFVDSDDWIEERILKGMLQRMEDDELDVIRFGFRRVVDEGSVANCSVERRMETASVWTGHDYLMNKLGFICYVWQFMIKRSVLVDNRLLFRPGIIFEDTEWTPRLLERARRISESGELVYDYRQREGSITKGSIQKVVNGQMVLIDLLKEQMDYWDNKCWHQGMIAHIALSIVTLASTDLFSHRKAILKELKDKDIYPLSTFNVGKNAMRKIRIINLSPRLATLIIHAVNI